MCRARISRVPAGRIIRQRARFAGAAAGSLVQCDNLPAPLFTPATKAPTGHDENISEAEFASIVGNENPQLLRHSAFPSTRRVATTRVAAGLLSPTRNSNSASMIRTDLVDDEVLTPDSSRFWAADQYSPGKAQASFDKQFVREYLERLRGTSSRRPRAAAGSRRGDDPSLSRCVPASHRTRSSSANGASRGRFFNHNLTEYSLQLIPIRTKMAGLINEFLDRQILLEEAISEFEKLYIEKALDRNIGHVLKTASATRASTEIRSQSALLSYKSRHLPKNVPPMGKQKSVPPAVNPLPAEPRPYRRP